MIVMSVQIKTAKTQKHLYCPVFTKPPLWGGFSFRPGSFGPAHPQRNGQREEDCGSGAIIPEGFSRRLKES